MVNNEIADHGENNYDNDYHADDGGKIIYLR